MWIYHSWSVQLMYIWVAFTSTILLTTSVNSHSQISYEHVFISLGTVPLCGIFDHMVTIVFLKNHCKASVHGQSHHQCMQVLLSINLFWCAVGDDAQSLAPCRHLTSWASPAYTRLLLYPQVVFGFLMSPINLNGCQAMRVLFASRLLMFLLVFVYFLWRHV